MSKVKNDNVRERMTKASAIPPGGYFRKPKGKKFYKVINPTSIAYVGIRPPNNRVCALSNKGNIEIIHADADVVMVSSKIAEHFGEENHLFSLEL